MQHIVRDSPRWALAGLVAGTVPGLVVALAMRLELASSVTLILVAGIMGMSCGPLVLIIYRAAQTAGPARLAYGALWGAAWGLALGLLYWWFYNSSSPVWHVILPIGFLAAAGLINAALDVHTTTPITESHPTTGHSKTGAK